MTMEMMRSLVDRTPETQGEAQVSRLIRNREAEIAASLTDLFRTVANSGDVDIPSDVTNPPSTPSSSRSDPECSSDPNLQSIIDSRSELNDRVNALSALVDPSMSATTTAESVSSQVDTVMTAMSAADNAISSAQRSYSGFPTDLKDKFAMQDQKISVLWEKVKKWQKQREVDDAAWSTMIMELLT